MGGLLLTALLHFLLLALSGMGVGDILDLSEGSAMDLSAGVTRAMLLIQHVFVFILPALTFALILYRSSFLKGLDLHVKPGWRLAVLGIFFLLVAYPLVNLSFLVNENIPLPAWAIQYEDQTAEILGLILGDMLSPWIFAINILIIAILPGIGEELIFRGILQKHLGHMLRHPIAGIWIAAAIFSAIHLQFEGFLPRMALGAILGYLYYWTGNLWVPIIAHAFNNGIQVAVIYATGMDLSTFDQESSGQLYAWMIPLSVGLMFLVYSAIRFKRNHVQHE